MKHFMIALTALFMLVASTTLVAQDKMQEKKDEMKKMDKMEKKDAMKMDKMDNMDKMSMASMSWKGYLVDKMCGSGYAKKDKETATSKAMKHTTACALEDDCKESGYGVLIDGKYHKFDEAGDKLAVEYLQKTKSKDNLFVEVKGSHEGEIVKVKSITEAKMGNMDKMDKMEKMDKMDKMEKQ